MNKDLITSLIYEKDLEETKEYLLNCEDAEDLHLYAYNYNWSNGFDIPKVIINNQNCSMSTALLIFYAADGLRYLTEKPTDTGLKEWQVFISDLYSKIISKSFENRNIAFAIPLTKIQSFKLKKALSEQETIFVKEYDGVKCDIDL